ncbi:MAG: phosphotriesterase family protein, partial [Candidatus Heimdallarchaeaceae archaeon]
VRTSNETGMIIQCHIFESSSVPSAIKIIEEEKLPYDRFIWVHADGQMDMEKILEFGKKGIWIEFDCIGSAEDFSKYPPAIKILLEEDLIAQLLFGQDSGSYWIKEEEEEWPMRPYARFFNEFIPYCEKEGIGGELINRVITENSKRALSIKQ